MTLDRLRSITGTFHVLAVDHRDSLRAFLAPDDPDSVSDGEITDLKIALVEAIAPEATGVMLEPEFSIPQVLDAGVLPDHVGFLAALESQGYLADPGAGPTTLLDGWSVEQAAACGASAAKLLLPYHPDRPLADAQQRVAADVAAECRRVGLPLALEPLFYDLDSPGDRPRVVLATVERFSDLGADLLKLPFPVDVVADGDRVHWRRRCREISDICGSVGVPWALLSGGGLFESFAEQLEVAADQGCAGFMVGRALWGEAALAAPIERARLIDDTVRPRFRQLSHIMESVSI